MSGSLRFESTSASSEELGYSNSGYSNGLKGNYIGSSLGRPGSFRESSENRIFGSGTPLRGHVAAVTEELPQLLQCLALEPFSVCDYKFNRLGEVRRVLGFPYGSVTENDLLGGVRCKIPPPVAQEDLKRFKESVADTAMKARGRTKKLVESLHKLNKYSDAINSHKCQRNEFLTSDKSGGLLLPKNGAQLQRSIQEDRTKNVNLNKRVRTAVADSRLEGRNNTLQRQNLLLGKDKDGLNQSSPGSDIPSEKFRQLSSGGEGWDRKVKRKRSTGNVFMRNSEDDSDLKRPMTPKVNSGSNLQLCDPQAGRYESTSGTSSIRTSAFSVSANARGMAKNEHEKVSLPRDTTSVPCKERVLTKLNNNKASTHEDSLTLTSSSVLKGKNIRAPRTSPITASSSSPNISRLSEATDGWKKPSSMSKFQSVNDNNPRKPPSIPGSSSTPMAQWVGQRPQKIKRNRRANFVSPVSNQDDVQTSSEGCSLDTGGRTNSSATNGSAHMKSASNGVKQINVKREIISSPGLLSESEESGSGDNKLEEKRKSEVTMRGNFMKGGQQTGSSLQPMKKNKLQSKDDSGDGVRRQGRSGRGSQTPRSNTTPTNEKLESTPKPIRNTRPCNDKSGSKFGRPPLKKPSDRSKFTRLGQLPNGSSPDCTGDSDDDHEELLAVSEFVRNLSSVACTNSFWKQMEKFFGSVRPRNEETPYLEQELKTSEQLHANLQQMLNSNDSILGNHMLDNVYISEEKERNLYSNVVSARTGSVINKFQDTNISSGSFKEFPPLYQRLLSALIVEDEFVEFDEAYGESDGTPHSSKYIFPSIIDHRKDEKDFEYNQNSGIQLCKRSVPNNAACNGNYLYDQAAEVHCNGKPFQEDNGANDGTLGHIDMPGVSPLNCLYDQMHLEDRLLLELRSIGLYPETVPELSEDDEMLDEEIVAFKRGLHELVNKKRLHLRKACEAIKVENEQEGRYLEQHAMDRLTEVAFRKLLASRGNGSSKSAPAKIPRQVALVFIKRTLARCRNFEASGKSCFGDPPMRNILADRHTVNISDPSHNDCAGFVPNRENLHGSIATPSDNPVFNRSKKKEVLLDDVGATTLRPSASLGSRLSGEAKGNRNERDSNARNNSDKDSNPKPKSSLHPTSAFPVRNTGIRNVPLETDSAKPKMDLTTTSLPLHDLESIEDIGVGTALGEHQDFDTWLNFDDDDAIPEHDALDLMDLSGLEIPMDDLSELYMF